MSVSLTKSTDWIDYSDADIAEMESELWDGREWVQTCAENWGVDSVAFAQAVESRDITRTVLRHMHLGQQIPSELL